MALSKQAVEIAHRLLLKIGGTNKYIREYHKDEQHPLNTVMGYHYHGDGWENVFMDIEDITPAQRQAFDEGKDAVPNSSFIDELPGSVTRIGWF